MNCLHNKRINEEINSKIVIIVISKQHPGCDTYDVHLVIAVKRCVEGITPVIAQSKWTIVLSYILQNFFSLDCIFKFSFTQFYIFCTNEKNISCILIDDDLFLQGLILSGHMQQLSGEYAVCLHTNGKGRPVWS